MARQPFGCNKVSALLAGIKELVNERRQIRIFFPIAATLHRRCSVLWGLAIAGDCAHSDDQDDSNRRLDGMCFSRVRRPEADRAEPAPSAGPEPTTTRRSHQRAGGDEAARGTTRSYAEGETARPGRHAVISRTSSPFDRGRGTLWPSGAAAASRSLSCSCSRLPAEDRRACRTGVPGIQA